MKIGIFGAGALGSLVGAYLSTEQEVVLYGRKPHVDAINDSGLKITGLGGNKIYNIPATVDLTNQDFDLGIIAVKGYDSGTILSELEKQEVKVDMIASIQNGLKDKALEEKFGKENVLGCVVNEAAEMEAPGQVCYVNNGCSFFGNFYPEEHNQKKTDLGKILASALCNCGLKAEVSNKMRNITWYKSMDIISTATISALDLDFNEIFSNDYASNLYLKNINEILSVAEVESIPIIEHLMLPFIFAEDAEQRKEKISELREIYKKVSEKQIVPFIAKELREGKPKTEAEHLIGTLLDIATEHKIPMPVTDTCYRIIKARELRNSKLIN